MPPSFAYFALQHSTVVFLVPTATLVSFVVVALEQNGRSFEVEYIRS